MKSFFALGLLCAMGAGLAAGGADPTAPAAGTTELSPQKVVAPAPGPVLTQGPVVTPADPWAEAMAAFATADSADAHAGGVVFVGSSSIRLWADLEKRYRSYAAVNRGFGGSTLADCVKHMDRLVLPHKPRLVVIYAGDNDLAGGRSSDQVLLDFVELTSRIQERLPKTQIVFVSIKPSPARIDLLSRIRDTNTKIRDYVTTKPYLRYIDVFTPMLDAQGKPRGELFGGDALHLNAEGYALWHALISPVLPTEEQPAMVKSPEPRDPSRVGREAGGQKTVAAKPVQKSPDRPRSGPPKAPPATVADAKSAASPDAPAVGGADAKPPSAATATTLAGDGDAAFTDLSTTPETPKTVRANVEPADAAPPVPATPPFAQPSASAEGDGNPATAQDPQAAAVSQTQAPSTEAPPSEIARLPPPPRTVRANVQPAHTAPAAPPADAGGAGPSNETGRVSDGVPPGSGPAAP